MLFDAVRRIDGFAVVVAGQELEVEFVIPRAINYSKGLIFLALGGSKA